MCLELGITGWTAWLVAPVVDLSVVGLLTGMRYLSLRGCTDAELAGPRRMLRFCGLLTLALNTAGSIADRQYGTALVDAVGPALLMGWSEVGPWMLRQVHAVSPAASNVDKKKEENRKQELNRRGAATCPPACAAGRAKKLDAEHRTAAGRPISRDNLRAQLRIGRDRASALVAAVRAEIAAGDPEALSQAA